MCYIFLSDFGVGVIIFKKQGVSMKIRVSKNDALIVVDVQNDFMPWGALPVPDGDKVVPVLNQYIQIFVERGASIFASRDWHPERHSSFKPYGGTWPVHCVRNTEGAMFHKDLKLPKDTYIISKATTEDKDAYSAFDGTNLVNILNERGIKRVFVGGLATDYCVKATVLDALRNDFCTFFLEDASRGVEVQKGDVEKAIETMLLNGAVSVTLKDLK